MKKSLIVLMSIVASASWAKHYFNVCYYNLGTKTAKYNNDGITRNWKDRGTLFGAGDIKAGQNKCFQASDETMFLTHYVTFYVNNKWVGIVNPGFSKAYAIGQDAVAKKGGKLGNNVDNSGHDQYSLNILIMGDGTNILSSASDPKDSASYITPRMFK